MIIGLFCSFLIHKPPIQRIIANSTENEPQILDLDLEMSQQIEISQRITSFNLNSPALQLVESNYMTFARFTVKNNGDELKKVTITLSSGIYEWEEVFQRKENLDDYCYDFTELTELYIPLEGIENINLPIILQAFFLLEYYPKISNTSARFTLVETSLRQVRSLPDSDLLFFPDVFYLNFPNHSYSFEIFKFTLTSYYLTNINASERLFALIELITELSVKILESSDITKTDQFDSVNFIGFNLIMDTNMTKRRVQLEIQRISGDFSYSIALKLQSIEKQLKATTRYGGNFPSHPIPSWLMMPFWLGFLFGVPIIFLLRHQKED
jgi:hypothetical protein